MSRFISADECIDLRLLGNEDYGKRDKGRLIKWAKHVWRELNLSTIKKAVRYRYKIDKKTNTVDLDCKFLQLSSVNVMYCGVEYPVYRNERLHDDIVDIPADKHCGCEHNCGYKLCSIIKSYEAVVSTKEDQMPNGDPVSFQCVDRKGVDSQGFFYEELQYPKRIYEDGVWMDTIFYTETRKLCEVEVDENGCCCDTEANIEAVCNSCGIKAVNSNMCCIGGTANTPPKPGCNEWIYYCNSKMEWLSTQCGGFPICLNEFNNIYNITELGDRLQFPHNFGFDEVIIRVYEDQDINDVKIPIVATETFVFGLMAWDTQFNDRKQGLADKYNDLYARRRHGLSLNLNKYRIAELAKIVAPSRYIPSYTVGTTNKYEGGRLGAY